MTGPIANNLTAEIKTDKGFSVIEIMISMAVFAIGVLAVAAMQVTSVSSNKSARVRSDAAVLAMDQMEYLKGLPFDHSDLAPKDSESPHGVAVPGHQITWTVRDDDPVANTKTMVVTVRQNEGGMQRPVTVEGMRADLFQ